MAAGGVGDGGAGSGGLNDVTSCRTRSWVFGFWNWLSLLELLCFFLYIPWGGTIILHTISKTGNSVSSFGCCRIEMAPRKG